MPLENSTWAFDLEVRGRALPWPGSSRDASNPRLHDHQIRNLTGGGAWSVVRCPRTSGYSCAVMRTLRCAAGSRPPLRANWPDLVRGPVPAAPSPPLASSVAGESRGRVGWCRRFRRGRFRRAADNPSARTDPQASGAGDAVLTVNVNSARDFLAGGEHRCPGRRISRPGTGRRRRSRSPSAPG